MLKSINVSGYFWTKLTFYDAFKLKKASQFEFHVAFNLNLWLFRLCFGRIKCPKDLLFFMGTIIFAFVLIIPYFSMSAIERLKQLESLYLNGSPYDSSFSLETLLDSLVCLYDECCNSTLRRERAIAEFVEFGEIRHVIRYFRSFSEASCESS